MTAPNDDKPAGLRGLVADRAGALRLASALSVASALLWPLQAAVIAGVLARLLTGAAGPEPWVAALAVLGLGLVRTALTHRAEGILFTAGEDLVQARRAAIVAQEAQGAGSGAFGGPGAVAALATEKLEALLPYLTRYAPARARVMVVPPLILALALWQSWAVAAILMLSGPVIPMFMALVGYAAKEASARQMVEIGSLNDLLVDRLSALADIRLLNAQDHVAADFDTAAEGLRARTMAVLRIAFLSSTVLELFAAIGVAMVAVWVGFSLLGELGWGAWGGDIAPASGIFLLLLAPDFYQPLRDLAAAWHDKAGADAVADELDAWQAQARGTMLGSGVAADPLPGPARVEWRGLAARRGDRLIRFPDAAIAPGEAVAVTGPSGAGKTSLLRLLAGLEPPESGTITVAGQPLDAATADAWRARLGWMPQAPHFLNRSLRFNIGFGARPRHEVLRDAVLDDVISTLPTGDTTVLGESGGGLSGGEARRVTLARAMQADPDVLLADEPTADLDAETAGLVADGLLALSARGCTLVVATHDPRLIARLDRRIDIEGPG